MPSGNYRNNWIGIPDRIFLNLSLLLKFTVYFLPPSVSMVRCMVAHKLHTSSKAGMEWLWSRCRVGVQWTALEEVCHLWATVKIGKQ